MTLSFGSVIFYSYICTIINQLNKIIMKTVIYNMNNFKIIKVVESDVSIKDLKDDEDFMPVDLWNESDDKERFPTIN